jgi:flagellar biosynthetic protein FlhB
MTEDRDRSSQTEAPTPRRLEEARKKGDVAKSQDLPAFMALAGAAAVVLGAGGWMARNMAEALLPFLAHPDMIELGPRGGVAVAAAAMKAAAPGTLILLVAALAGGAGSFIQHGFLWAPSKLAPDFSKLNPMSGLKRLFGLDGLVNFLKSLAKVGAISLLAFWIVKPRAADLPGLAAMEPAAVLPYTMEILKALTYSILAALAVVAGFDWFWQRQRFTARMRMTREEVKKDHKESDGDPHIKARQRQIRLERSRRRMIQNVPKATVVVMNPTHYAVALRYVQGEDAAPVCVAKGLDRLALKIREVAEQAGVAVVEDPPLARALYAAIEVDQTIPREHYTAVAKIVGFVMSGGRAGAARARPIPPQARPAGGARL